MSDPTSADPIRGGPPPGARRRLSIAIQAGGAQGAVAWGALDRVLRDERIEIEAIGGTSSGSVNACLSAYGLLDGSASGACRVLKDFWPDFSTSFEPSLGWSRAPLRTLKGIDHRATARRKFFELMRACHSRIASTRRPWSPFAWQ